MFHVENCQHWMHECYDVSMLSNESDPGAIWHSLNHWLAVWGVWVTLYSNQQNVGKLMRHVNENLKFLIILDCSVEWSLLWISRTITPSSSNLVKGIWTYGFPKLKKMRNFCNFNTIKLAQMTYLHISISLHKK